MAKSVKDTSDKPTKTQASPQGIAKSDEALSEEELKKVTGGPIYMSQSHGSGGGGGAG